MPCYISRLVQLCKNVLGKDFTKFNSHLIYDNNDESRVKGKEEGRKRSHQMS